MGSIELLGRLDPPRRARAVSVRTRPRGRFGRRDKLITPRGRLGLVTCKLEIRNGLARPHAALLEAKR